MAEVRLEGDTVIVHLSGLERLGAMRGDVRVPRSAVRECRVTQDPWSELRGIRSPGTGVPGLISLCTLKGNGTRDFAAIYRKRPAVVIELSGAEFDRLVVSVKEAAFAEELATHLSRAPEPPAA